MNNLHNWYVNAASTLIWPAYWVIRIPLLLLRWLWNTLIAPPLVRYVGDTPFQTIEDWLNARPVAEVIDKVSKLAVVVFLAIWLSESEARELRSRLNSFQSFSAVTSSTSGDKTRRDVFLYMLKDDWDLRGASFKGIYLSGSDLSNRDFQGSDFSDANLWGCELVDTNLIKAILINADLRNADLSLASLTLAKLNNAKLWLTNLTKARLSRANLTGADLTEANLTDAELDHVDLTNSDLSGAVFAGAILDQSRWLKTQPPLNRETLEEEIRQQGLSTKTEKKDDKEWTVITREK